jgi:hypothetical protein
MFIQSIKTLGPFPITYTHPYTHTYTHTYTHIHTHTHIHTPHTHIYICTIISVVFTF